MCGKAEWRVGRALPLRFLHLLMHWVLFSLFIPHDHVFTRLSVLRCSTWVAALYSRTWRTFAERGNQVRGGAGF
jgi:hypothetical protein